MQFSQLLDIRLHLSQKKIVNLPVSLLSERFFSLSRSAVMALNPCITKYELESAIKIFLTYPTREDI